MLVYLKSPMAISEIEGWKVYGKYYNYGRMGASNIPKEVYYKNRNLFDMAPITGQWLSKKTGREFPQNISFTYPEMSLVSDKEWIELAKYFDIVMSDDYFITYEKRIWALKNSIVEYVEGLI